MLTAIVVISTLADLFVAGLMAASAAAWVVITLVAACQAIAGRKPCLWLAEDFQRTTVRLAAIFILVTAPMFLALAYAISR